MDESGNPRYVTAQDVVYGWTRALDPATGISGAYMLAPVVAGGDDFNSGGGSASDLQIRAVDDFTFEVTAPEKVAYALGIYGLITPALRRNGRLTNSGDAWTEPENINTTALSR